MPKNRYCAIQNCVHNKGTSDASVRMFRYIEYQLLNLINELILNVYTLDVRAI